MLVKTTKTPARGSKSACLDYLCGEAEKGAENEIERQITREGARLLSGDIHLTQAYINQAGEKFTHSHTAGVLSFEEANISEVEKQAIMESFEACLLPGLERDEYNILWVEHRDKGRLELNWVVPRIHLQTEAHLQPYFDPVDRPRHKAWQEMINAKYGYSSPEEPIKKQTITTTFRLPKEKAEIVAKLDEYICQQAPESRQGVIDALNAIEGIKVVREAKSSLSIRAEGYEQNIRLKGAFYEQDYRGDRSEAERIRTAQAKHQTSIRERFERSQTEYASRHRRAATANRAKYDRIAANARRRAEKASKIHQQQLQKTANDAMDSPTISDRGIVISDLAANPIKPDHRRDAHQAAVAMESERKSDRNRLQKTTATSEKIESIFNGKFRKSDTYGDRKLGERATSNIRHAEITARTNRHTAGKNRRLAERARELAEAIKRAIRAKLEQLEKLRKQMASRSYTPNHDNDRGFSR